MAIPLYKYPFTLNLADSCSIDELQLQASVLKAPGLIYGKMGSALFFFEYARFSGVSRYEDLGMTLLEDAVENLSHNTPLNYADGLCGIGCGVEYLVQSGYLENDADELLSDIDRLVIHEIHWQHMTNVNLMFGISGLGYYLYWRTRKPVDTMKTLLLKEYLIYLIDWIDQLTPLMDKDREEVYYLLMAIRSTGFYKNKVDKLIRSLTFF